MFELFKKKPNKFIVLLIEQAALTNKGVEILQKYMKLILKISKNVCYNI